MPLPEARAFQAWVPSRTSLFRSNRLIKKTMKTMKTDSIVVRTGKMIIAKAIMQGQAQMREGDAYSKLALQQE